MITQVRLMGIFGSFAVAAALASYLHAPFAAAQSAAKQAASVSPQSLNFEFFKTRVQPIFLKRRSPDHARCYACHVVTKHGVRGFYLEPLSPGSSFWTEEQSRLNFQVVSKLVVAVKPLAGPFPGHPLAPEAGGLPFRHDGGRQFESQDDPDFRTLIDWVRGKKAGVAPGQ